MAGDIERAGTAGGGPGSVAGNLLWMDLEEGVGACMVVEARLQFNSYQPVWLKHGLCTSAEHSECYVYAGITCPDLRLITVLISSPKDT